MLALAMLATPLVLALLMVLFDTTARGLMELLGWLVGWICSYLPLPGGRTASYQSLQLHPWQIAGRSALLVAPCLGGLLLMLSRHRGPAVWLGVAGLWLLSACLGGAVVAWLLLPGSALALGFALASRRR